VLSKGSDLLSGFVVGIPPSGTALPKPVCQRANLPLVAKILAKPSTTGRVLPSTGLITFKVLTPTAAKPALHSKSSGFQPATSKRFMLASANSVITCPLSVGLSSIKELRFSNHLFIRAGRE